MIHQTFPNQEDQMTSIWGRYIGKEIRCHHIIKTPQQCIPGARIRETGIESHRCRNKSKLTFTRNHVVIKRLSSFRIHNFFPFRMQWRTNGRSNLGSSIFLQHNSRNTFGRSIIPSCFTSGRRIIHDRYKR